jgi:hypothetical protein
LDTCCPRIGCPRQADIHRLILHTAGPARSGSGHVRAAEQSDGPVGSYRPSGSRSCARPVESGIVRQIRRRGVPAGAEMDRTRRGHLHTSPPVCRFSRARRGHLHTPRRVCRFSRARRGHVHTARRRVDSAAPGAVTCTRPAGVSIQPRPPRPTAHAPADVSIQPRPITRFAAVRRLYRIQRRTGRAKVMRSDREAQS